MNIVDFFLGSQISYHIAIMEDPALPHIRYPALDIASRSSKMLQWSQRKEWLDIPSSEQAAASTCHVCKHRAYPNTYNQLLNPFDTLLPSCGPNEPNCELQPPVVKLALAHFLLANSMPVSMFFFSTGMSSATAFSSKGFSLPKGKTSSAPLGPRRTLLAKYGSSVTLDSTYAAS